MANIATITLIRNLIGDVDPASQLLTDDQVDAYADLNPDAPLLAAAQALEVIAVSATLVMRKIRTNDLSTDGPAVSAELRALAKTFRQQHADNLAAADEWDGFDVVDTLPGYGTWPEATTYVTGL